MRDRAMTFWVLVFLLLALVGLYGLHAGWYSDPGCVPNQQASTCD